MPPSVRRTQLPRQALRPSNARPAEATCPRQFSYKHPRQFLVAHPGSSRPQLPFLYPSGQHLSSGQVARLFSISANHKKFIKETAKLSIRYSVLIFLASSCISIAGMGILSEQQERAFPSPHEWSLITRFRFRRGRWWQVPENNDEEGFPNWARVYDELDHALSRLEDPNIDGACLYDQEEGGILVPGVGKAGYDITAKSEEWRQGYYEVLIGMAAAAERLEGWVTDRWRRNVWAPEFVESKSNPRPKAVLPGMPEVPDEDNRVAASDSPESFYLKIITTKGFTTNQRVTAALSYADWLSFKKLPDSAEEMYRWALDIAISGLPIEDPSAVIHRQTAVLSATAPKELVTPNIVHAATNLATFLASQGKVGSSLPILVSLLRARLSANEAPPSSNTNMKDPSLMGTILSLLKEPAYPAVPPSGNEPLLRDEKDRCEEAALKNYIGEILFATAGTSSEQHQQGLSWVRDGVSTSKIAQSLEPISTDEDLRKKCEKCEEVGLESWGKIMTYLAAEARDKRDAAVNGGLLTRLIWKFRGTQKLEQDVENFEGEEEGVVMRLNKLRSKMLRDEYAELDRKYSRTFVF